MNDFDPFGLALERESDNVEPQLGLVTPGSIPADELPIIEACYRLQAHPACHSIIFTDTADDGTEIFENSDQWQAILGFPRRPPTVAECLEWSVYHDAVLAGVVWFTLQEHRAKQAQDKAAQPPRRAPECGNVSHRATATIRTL